MSIEHDPQYPLEHDNSAPLLSCRISGPGAKPAKWIWLFPLTYLAHIAEEVWGGQGFAVWISRAPGVHLSVEELVISNATGWAVMTIGVLLVSRYAKWRWVLTALAGIVLLNAMLHTAGSIMTWSYSPGLVTSLVLWLPLGLLTLFHEWSYAARSTFAKGLTGTIAFHVLVLLAVLTVAQSRHR